MKVGKKNSPTIDIIINRKYIAPASRAVALIEFIGSPFFYACGAAHLYIPEFYN